MGFSQDYFSHRPRGDMDEILVARLIACTKNERYDIFPDASMDWENIEGD